MREGLEYGTIALEDAGEVNKLKTMGVIPGDTEVSDFPHFLTRAETNRMIELTLAHNINDALAMRGLAWVAGFRSSQTTVDTVPPGLMHIPGQPNYPYL